MRCLILVEASKNPTEHAEVPEAAPRVRNTGITCGGSREVREVNEAEPFPFQCRPSLRYATLLSKMFDRTYSSSVTCRRTLCTRCMQPCSPKLFDRTYSSSEPCRRTLGTRCFATLLSKMFDRAHSSSVTCRRTLSTRCFATLLALRKCLIALLALRNVTKSSVLSRLREFVSIIQDIRTRDVDNGLLLFLLLL